MLAKLLLILLIICFNPKAFSQLNISPIWCFGNKAGIDFSNTNYKTFTSSVNSSEGSAGVTDENNNLLFYTDGSTVYNKNHQTMPNGTGLFGSSSSSQSAIVLQHESQKSSNQFYIFTIPEYAGQNGFCYSIVDMDEDQGNGDVIVKNKNIFGILSEQMQPALHSNGKDYWIVIKGHANTNLYSFLIDNNGIQLKKTTSLGNSVNNTIGCMRFNSNYSKFVYSCYDFSGYVQICDFNTNTGEITNPIIIDDLYDPYGVSFSPNGKLLYVSHLLTRKINQYDISSNNPSIIKNSSFSLTNASFAYGNINVAYDNKLYVSVTGQNFVSCISSPNSIGSACNFNLNGIDISPNSCNYGLPLFYIYEKERVNSKINILKSCIEDSIEIYESIPRNLDSLSWIIKQGNSEFKYSNLNPLKFKLNKLEKCNIYEIYKTDTFIQILDPIKCNDTCLQIISNVFTPNEDEINDVFYYNFNCYKTSKFQIEIYNRWGVIIYMSNNKSDSWDGKYKKTECASGTYYYIISYFKENKKILKNGVITLIR